MNGHAYNQNGEKSDDKADIVYFWLFVRGKAHVRIVVEQTYVHCLFYSVSIDSTKGASIVSMIRWLKHVMLE